LGEDVNWWYLSFAEPNVDEGGTAPVGEGFRGGLYIEAASLADAVTQSHELGLNPGGEVAGIEIPAEAMADFEENVPPELRLRLLSKNEVEGL
jgi:hypothetical protein